MSSTLDSRKLDSMTEEEKKASPATGDAQSTQTINTDDDDSSGAVNLVELVRTLNSDDIDRTEHKRRLDALKKEHGEENVKAAIYTLKREAEEVEESLETITLMNC